jgi:hypothetical protein
MRWTLLVVLVTVAGCSSVDENGLHVGDARDNVVAAVRANAPPGWEYVGYNDMDFVPSASAPGAPVTEASRFVTAANAVGRFEGVTHNVLIHAIVDQNGVLKSLRVQWGAMNKWQDVSLPRP